MVGIYMIKNNNNKKNNKLFFLLQITHLPSLQKEFLKTPKQIFGVLCLGNLLPAIKANMRTLVNDKIDKLSTSLRYDGIAKW